MPHRNDPRPGFTLLEAMVALVVGSLVVLGARSLMNAVASEADRIARVARETDERANARRWLTQLVGQLEIGAPETHPFEGDPQFVQFSTWCPSPYGWQERCDAQLRFESRGDTNVLTAHLAPLSPGANIGPSSVTLAKGFRAGSWRYLNDARAGGQWFVAWGKSLVPPLAVGLILERDSTTDTTIVRIGERG